MAFTALLNRGAVTPEVVRRCVDVIEGELRVRAVDPCDRATWTEPVVRFSCPDGRAHTATLPPKTGAALLRRLDVIYACHFAPARNFLMQ